MSINFAETSSNQSANQIIELQKKFNTLDQELHELRLKEFQVFEAEPFAEFITKVSVLLSSRFKDQQALSLTDEYAKLRERTITQKQTLADSYAVLKDLEKEERQLSDSQEMSPKHKQTQSIASEINKHKNELLKKKATFEDLSKEMNSLNYAIRAKFNNTLPLKTKVNGLKSQTHALNLEMIRIENKIAELELEHIQSSNEFALEKIKKRDALVACRKKIQKEKKVLLNLLGRQNKIDQILLQAQPDLKFIQKFNEFSRFLEQLDEFEMPHQNTL